MIALMLLWASAWAAPEGAVNATSETTFQVRPNLFTGTPWGGFGERLGLDATLPKGFSLSAGGGLRFRVPDPGETITGDLWRLSFSHTGQIHRVDVGRIARLDARGFQRLDGAAAEIKPSGPASVSVWAGRLWTPAHWAPDTTVVAGVQGHYRPMVDGMTSKAVQVTAGWEGRYTPKAAFRNRLMGAFSFYGPRNARLNALLEGETGSDKRVPVRAEVHGGGPVGHHVDLRGDLAWQGLDHPSSPDGAITPFDWLTQDGYGIASVGLVWAHGPFSVDAVGGPTLQVDHLYTPVPGGHGRVAFGARIQHASFGVFANGASIGGSWMAGGGAEVGGHWERYDFVLDSAVDRMTPLDGSARWLGEARARGSVELLDITTGELENTIGLALEAATGTDRMLSPWVRGGLAIQIGVRRTPGATP